MTDHCSGGMSLLWRACTKHGPPWEWCCDKHDMAYEELHGGPEADRKWADGILRDCVAMSGHPVWAWTIYAAVRAGGWWYWYKWWGPVAEAKRV